MSLFVSVRRRARLRALCAMTMLALGPAAAGAQPPPQPAGPLPPPGTALTLQDALARAAEHGPLVRAARERQQAAAAARAVVPRLPNPVIELRGENFGPHPRAQLPLDVFATISQPIELGGKRAARVAGADATVAVADADLRVSQWALAFDVAGLYIEALRGRDVLATLTEQQAGLAELVSTLSQRVREGVSPEADARKFETEYQRLVRHAARTDIAARGAALRLSVAVGLDVQLDRLAPLPLPAADLPPRVAPDRLERRPDVEAARARVVRAEAVLAAERARGVPDVTVTTGYKRTSGFDTGVAAVTLPINLFDRNRVASSLAAGEAAAARAELARTRQFALADAEARLEAAHRLAAQAATARQDLLDPAAIVRSAARAAYVEGHGDVLQLVDAERVFAEASREVVELQLDALIAHITARLALGETPLP